MAKKIRFPLILAEGAQVRSLDELREHFDLEAVLGYYKTGKLLTWLEDRYLEGEAKAIRALDEAVPDFQLRLCEALGGEYTGADVDLEAIRIRQERLARLRSVTDEDEFLQNIDSVAFDQEELADLLDEEQTTVYLCGERFTVPASRKGITYVGINEPEVKISGDLPENFDELGITFRACKVDRPEPPKPEQPKSEGQKEIPQGAKIVAVMQFYSERVTNALAPNMRVVNGWRDIVSVTCSNQSVIGIKRDGSVVTEGYGLEQWECCLNQWEMICSVAVGTEHIVGLQKNGTVMAGFIKGPCPPQKCMVNNWTEITAVACGEDHTVGLRKDGTVVAVGKNRHRYYWNGVQYWKDIISIGCTNNATYGLKRDGTVVGTGYNYDYNVSNWTDIVSIDCNQSTIAGLKRDGTVVVGCGLAYLGAEVSGWRDIISVACGDSFVAGLRRDRTVVVAINDSKIREAQNWKNVVSIVADQRTLVGIVGPEG